MIHPLKLPHWQGLMFILLFVTSMQAQNLQVKTIIPDIQASGGVTLAPDGSIIVSDFGAGLSKNDLTKVYRVNAKTGVVTEFASGFKGASGACFDSKGNFYQSNPWGNQVSKMTPDGKIIYNWAMEGIEQPIGIKTNSRDELFVCNCRGNNISKIDSYGNAILFAKSADFACPNGMTIDENDNLYTCNFGNGKIIKITPKGETSVIAELPELQGGPNPVGIGHLDYANGVLFVAAIGKGLIFKISLDGKTELIAGSGTFSNTDGTAMDASFSKPNGIAASVTGDTLYVNCSEPSWVTNPQALYPAPLRIIIGVCSLADVKCPSQRKK